MLFRHFVALRALERNVMRQHLDVIYIAMTGRALRGSMRKLRIVRVMTRHARFAGIVSFRDNLRETRGTRSIIAVTQRTKITRLRFYGVIFKWIIHMLCGWPMTRFAGNAAVP